MNGPNLIHASTPIDAAELDRVERQFGFVFPDDLRAIYAEFNGGQPIRRRLITDDDTYMVNMFLPIKHAPASGAITIERCIQWMKIDKQIIPKDLVPFAVDSFGGFLCFSVRKDEFGAIYLYRQDGCSEPEKATKFLAPSVTDLLSRLSA